MNLLGKKPPTAKPLPVIWLNRPAEDSIETANRLHNLGMGAVISPVMHIIQLSHHQPPSMDACIITSKYAMQALQHIARTTPLFVVGRSLSAKLGLLGFTQIHTYPTASAMVRDIPHHVSPKSHLCYVRGEVIRLNIAEILRSLLFKVTETICYKAQVTTELSTELVAQIKAGKTTVIAPFYAIQAVQFANILLKQHQLSSAKSRIEVLCISKTVASQAQQLGFHNIFTSDRADGTAMQQLIHNRFIANTNM